MEPPYDKENPVNFKPNADIARAFKEMRETLESELRKMEDKISDLKAMVKDKDEIIALLKSRDGAKKN
jgi:hypothetical protein